jgi:hypothetical protein
MRTDTTPHNAFILCGLCNKLIEKEQDQYAVLLELFCVITILTWLTPNKMSLRPSRHKGQMLVLLSVSIFRYICTVSDVAH